MVACSIPYQNLFYSIDEERERGKNIWHALKMKRGKFTKTSMHALEMKRGELTKTFGMP